MQLRSQQERVYLLGSKDEADIHERNERLSFYQVDLVAAEATSHGLTEFGTSSLRGL